MATSGSKNFSITRGGVIRAALKKIGAYDAQEAVPGSEDEDAAIALNLLVKEWSALGLDIWLRSEVTLFLQKNQQSYQIGLNSVDHATTDTIAESTVAVSAAMGSNIVTVVDSTGMNAADNVGIKLDDGTLYWTTYTDPSGGLIAVAIPSAASAGNRVYTYTK